MRLFVVTLGWGFLLLTAKTQAIIVGVATPNPEGGFTYSYTVDNVEGTFAISAFSLTFDIPSEQLDFDRTDVAGGGDVVVPNADWLAFETPFSVAETGLDIVNLFETPVPVGETLGGFSFESRFPPVETVPYVEYSAAGEFRTGLTVGPIIPEVSSTLLAGLGLAILAFRRRHSPSTRSLGSQ